MHHLLITTDLHQHPAKWNLLAKAAAKERPQFVLIAGDILPKDRGISRQGEFFPYLRELLTGIRDQTGARILLFLSNDDGHFLEPLVNELEADNLCVNMNQRVYREADLVFCGMNKVRDYPFDGHTPSLDVRGVAQSHIRVVCRLQRGKEDVLIQESNLFLPQPG